MEELIKGVLFVSAPPACFILFCCYPPVALPTDKQLMNGDVGADVHL